MTDTAKAFDAVAALTEDGWIWDGDQWQRPPQQEPVAWMSLNDYDDRVSVYAAPPQRPWVGLTDDEFDALEYRFARYELCRAIEAKLKEKNT